MRPIAAVATPIIISVTMSVAVRPIRSPIGPKIAAPSGRAAKPTKYVLNDSSAAMYGSLFGKNLCGKISAAATP